jgi:2,3-bisphosphoglycerate-independent phosphoglycerate mutase
VLEQHPINRVRVDLGENPANMIWLWGAASASPHKTFTERTGLSAAVVSSSFLVRGLARSFGLDWEQAPSSLEEGALQRLTKTLVPLIEHRDLVYIHLRIDTADPVERFCAMERIDQALLKPLTDVLPTRGPWRLLVGIEDSSNASVSMVAIGTGLPQHPVIALTSEQFANSPLTFQDGSGLFSWLTQRQATDAGN